MDAGLSWTDERVALLKKLWGDGLSASQIAAQIGGISRNAVIGKVHRLGLAGRAKPNAAAQPQRPRKAVAKPAGEPLRVEVRDTPRSLGPADAVEEPELTAMPVTADVALPASERVTIMELRDSMCRWPLGDPTNPEFRFCGARSITGLPYCPHHARVAYQPVADRRRDRRIAIRA